MLRVVAKPFTGLQMTQLGGELQGLFAPRSNLHFYLVAASRAKPAVWPGSVPNSSRCGFIAKICESAGARNWQPGRNRHLRARNMHVSVRGNPIASRNKDLVRAQIAGYIPVHANESGIVTSIIRYFQWVLKNQLVNCWVEYVWVQGTYPQIIKIKQRHLCLYTVVLWK